MILDQIADKWSILIPAALYPGTSRSNALRRQLDGVTQKTLTQTLRRLERPGLIKRAVNLVSPIAVEYGHALEPVARGALASFFHWTVVHGPELEAAKPGFDRERGEHK